MVDIVYTALDSLMEVAWIGLLVEVTGLAAAVSV